MYKKILVAVSLADGAGPGILDAAKSLLAAEGELQVLYVLDNRYVQFVFDPSLRGSATEDMAADAIEKAQLKLIELCAGCAIEEHQATVLFGHPADVIREVASNSNSDLIVMGTHGRRGWRRILGSVANEVLHGAPTNVFLCRSALPAS